MTRLYFSLSGQVLQSAGVEGEQCILLMEDYQFMEGTFVELINSLLSAGEVPGLYTPDEMESILSPLREDSSQEGFRGTMVQYFAQSKLETPIEVYFLSFAGVKTNLHIVLVMDFTRPTFTSACQSNPGFFKECAVQWMEGWSERSMLRVIVAVPYISPLTHRSRSFRFHRCSSPKTVPMKVPKLV